MRMRLEALCLLTVFWLGDYSQAFTISRETELRSERLTNYSLAVRPSPVTTIYLRLHVTSIKKVDITNEAFSMSGWWSMSWQDDRLAWNTTEYPIIRYVQYYSDSIWTPALVASNSLNDLSAIDEDTIPARVDSTGLVTWTPPALLEVGCSMDVTYFPFDEQTCGIEVTSFGYTVEELNVNVRGTSITFQYYQPNGEWDLKRNWSEREEFSEDGFRYARVTFNFFVIRKPLYYGLNLILPVIVSSALTLFVFLLPAESGEKIGYCLTLLLAFMVILTIVAQELPTTAISTSILEVYIAIVMCMGGGSVILSIIVLQLYFRPDEKPIPAWVRKLTIMGMKFCCEEPCSCCSRRVEPTNRTRPGSLHRDSTGLPVPDYPLSNDLIDPLSYKYTRDTSFNTHDSRPVERPRLIKKISMMSFQSTNSIGAQAGAQEHEITWRLVSSTLDGVLLRLYFIFLLVSSAVILGMLASA